MGLLKALPAPCGRLSILRRCALQHSPAPAPSDPSSSSTTTPTHGPPASMGPLIRAARCPAQGVAGATPPMRPPAEAVADSPPPASSEGARWPWMREAAERILPIRLDLSSLPAQLGLTGREARPSSTASDVEHPGLSAPPSHEARTLRWAGCALLLPVAWAHAHGVARVSTRSPKIQPRLTSSRAQLCPAPLRCAGPRRTLPQEAVRTSCRRSEGLKLCIEGTLLFLHLFGCQGRTGRCWSSLSPGHGFEEMEEERNTEES